MCFTLDAPVWDREAKIGLQHLLFNNEGEINNCFSAVSKVLLLPPPRLPNVGFSVAFDDSKYISKSHCWQLNSAHPNQLLTLSELWWSTPWPLGPLRCPHRHTTVLQSWHDCLNMAHGYLSVSDMRFDSWRPWRTAFQDASGCWLNSGCYSSHSASCHHKSICVWAYFCPLTQGFSSLLPCSIGSLRVMSQ